MSRLLDLLRRQRSGNGPGVRYAGALRGMPPARSADRPIPAGNTAVVLDALSGRRRTPPWYRRRVVTALAVLAAVAILLSSVVPGSRTAGDRDRTPAGTRSVTERGGGQSRGGPVAAPAGREDRVPAARQHDNVAPRPPRSETSPANAPTVTTVERDSSEDRRGGWIAEAGGGTSTEDERFDRALQHQQAGEVDAAIAEYRALLQVNETNPRAHNNLGLLYQGEGRVEEAVGEFRRAIAIDPDYGKARNNLGVALLRAGNVEAAASEFRRVLSADPRNDQAMVNLALAQRAAGHPDLARETLIRAIEINDRDAAAHYNLGLLYEDARDIVRALDHYDAYLKYAAGADAKQLATVREHCEALRQRLR